LASTLVWCFVWEQRDLIARPGLFWTLIGVLLLLSFWTSATEAAYAVVEKRGPPPSLVKAVNKEAQRLSEVAASAEFIKNPDLLDNRVLKRLVARSDTHTKDLRGDLVGAFACAS